MPPGALTLPVPDDYVLARDVCSYGYFLLAPNLWSPHERRFITTLNTSRAAVTLTISQPPRHTRSAEPRSAGPITSARELLSTRGRPLHILPDRPLPPRDERLVRDQLTRMLNLTTTARDLREFHRLDPRFKPLGRGRLFRSPSFFEDVIKTVTSCNVTWPGTISMNARLCATLGRRSPTHRHAFPTPQALAAVAPARLRATCRVGYRDARLVELATRFADGRVDVEWFENPSTPDADLRAALLDLPGVGPYAAHNILQLLGRYDHLPLDTESVRHARNVLNFKGTSHSLMKRIDAHFAPFAPHRFRSYWFELWNFYEARRGHSWTWDPATTGTTFTAAQLKP